MYNVAMMRFCVPLLLWKSKINNSITTTTTTNYYYYYKGVIILALVIRHENSTFSAPQTSVALWLHHIFPHIFQSARFSGKNVLNMKCVF
jgi:hypothetical protein